MMQVMTCAEAYDLIYVSTVGCEGIIYDILANLIRFMAFEESKKKKKKKQRSPWKECWELNLEQIRYQLQSEEKYQISNCQTLCILIPHDHICFPLLH